MRIDLFVVYPLGQSLILLGGEKSPAFRTPAMREWQVNVIRELDGESISEVIAFLRFSRRAGSRPLLENPRQGLGDGPQPEDIATFDTLMGRSRLDAKWHPLTDQRGFCCSLRVFLALILWQETGVNEWFKEGPFDGTRYCLICGRENVGEYRGRANMSGTKMYSFHPYCEWPDCYSHRLNREMIPSYSPDFSAHERRLAEERSQVTQMAGIIRGAVSRS